jgi:hypothetical protein
MTYQTSMGRVQARLSLDLLVCLAACANGLVARVIEDLRGPSPSLLLGLSPFELLAAALAARAITQGKAADFAPARVSLAHGLAALSMLAPSAAGAWIVLFAFSLWRAPHARGMERAGLLVFAGLGLAQAWAAVGFKLISGPLLALDAALTARALDLLGLSTRLVGNVVEVTGGHAIVVLVTCATLHRLPLALVAALALAAPASARRCAMVCVLAGAGYCALNLVRLTLMGLSPDHYAFMHEGAGASLYDAAQTILVFLVAGRKPVEGRAP